MQIGSSVILNSAVTVTERNCDDDVGERRVPPKTVSCDELAKDSAVQLFHRPGAQPSKLPATHLTSSKDRLVTDAVDFWRKQRVFLMRATMSCRVALCFPQFLSQHTSLFLRLFGSMRRMCRSDTVLANSLRT